ncbi:transporter substrate-binding domain-containing protein [Curvibacter sp. APW13]|uniref:substrate-binding periplasmic protein n=1 Tax=Curvibacter sp. APW13 TaxID=3077236 RepID=UPI0028DE1EFD|nr:transporter substrate-binding domain-containing protein [Curvibacter sp. APW13]MDT8992000.1 transporter substrate-binding domain-containing protein [Curvibacter sp. APW13]
MKRIDFSLPGLASAGLTCLALLALPVAAQVGSADTDLTILWTERIPFQYTGEDGKPRGLLVDIGRKLLAKAELSYTEVMLPANRVIMELTRNDMPACAIGWYMNDERAAFAQFSKPVYKDLPLRGVFRAGVDVPPQVTAATALTGMNMRILLKQGFAYGPYLDALLAKAPPERLQRVTGEATNLLKMIAADRADVVLLAQEEIEFYSAVDPAFTRNFKVLVFKDAPETERRYVMCSKRVSPDVMRKINAAIAATTNVR